MKKFLTSVAMALLLVGCAKEYDDSGLKERVSALETRVTALESNVQALQSAIGEGVFVAKVQEYVDPDTGKTIGVTVTYTNGDVKYFEITPQEDYDGPVLGVIKSGSGELVWAIDGIAILIDGKEVPVYQTPVFTLDEDGFLWVEVNGEKVKLGQVQNEGATLVDGIFTNIKVEQDKIVLTLSDETTVNIPFAEAFKIELMLDSCVYTAMEPIPVHYAITAATAGTVVRVAGYSPLDFVVAVNAEDKIIEITPLHPTAAAQFLVVADSGIGLVSTATLQVEPEGLKVVDTPATAEYDYVAEGEDASVSVHIVSNIVPEVKPVDAWIHVVDVKAQAYTITLSLDDNKTGEVRTGTVNILKKGTEEIIQTLTIGQLASEIEEGPANLSKKESANSYIVYAPGAYKFKAVKGNSDTPVGDVATVEILWETYNNDQEVVANSVLYAAIYVEGYVMFSTPETLTPGNALIVAKDNAGEILWSWLIWVPGSEIKTVDAGFADTKFPLMDRNLGALVAASTSAKDVTAEGLYYQWGRPTPLLSKNKKAVPAIDYAANYTTTACADVATGIKTPLMFYHVEGGDWLATPDNTLWGATKTEYDPCPPGYMVPGYDTTLDMWKKVSNEDYPTLWNYDETAAYCQFKTAESVFPLAGYINGSSQGLSGYGKRSLVWSHVAASDTKASGMFIRENKYYSDGNHKASGASVRCVVVNEGAINPPTPNPGGGEVVEEAKDLSAEGTANCYVVSEAGTYTFKTVQGNSEESVGTVATADILWETYNNAEEVTANSVIAAVSYAEGYITFSTPETLVPGNALIAAKDEAGEILWSWHIWIPATEIVIQEGSALCGTDIMDRNLGALKAMPKSGDPDPLSIGLCFQWGRKDPFPGIVSFTSNTGASVAGTAWTAKGEHITTAYSIAHPTEYAHIKEVDEGVWNVDDPQDLWNDADNMKTIYDPCPVGYRVPLYDSSYPMWKGSFGDDWVLDGENYRFSYGDIVFPIGGYIDCWTPGYAKTGERTHIWASKWYDAERSTCLYYRADKDNKYYSQKFHKAKAGSVRCVAEIPAN